MKTIAILDLEATDKNPDRAAIVEIAVCLWSVEHRTRTTLYSTLVHCTHNAAARMNHIPVAALLGAPPLEKAFAATGHFVARADAIAAHNGDAYDRPLLERHICPWARAKPWIDTMTDIEWPAECGGLSLLAIAHAHGVQIGPLHRAADDVACVAALLERAGEMGADIDALLARALRPKARFVAEASRAMNDVLKEHRFRWDPERREWWRRMPVEDARELPFAVREAS